MAMYVKFGVKGWDLEKLAPEVARIVNLSAQPRYGDNRGGDYYAFGQLKGERLLLLNNKDLYDKEPLHPELGDWDLLLFLNDTNPDSAVLNALDQHPKVFVKLETIHDSKSIRH